jgi:integrase
VQPYIQLYLESLTSDKSKKAVVKNLRALLNRVEVSEVVTDESVVWFAWHTLSLSQYSTLKNTLVNEGKSASYINTLLTILRQVLSWALTNDQLPEKSFEKIKRVITSVSSNKKRQSIRDVDDDEVDFDWLVGQSDNLSNLSNESDLGAMESGQLNALIRSIGSVNNMATRNKAIFMCMAYAGLRREEVAQLRLQDLHFARSHADSFIKIIGKGAKLRDVPMNAELYRALINWSRLIMGTGNKKKSSSVFRKINIVGKVLVSGLSNDGIYKIIRKVGEDEDVLGLHPHKLRHYFATRLLLAGRDVFEVARLLGHSNVETTRRYDDRGFDTLQDAVRML